MTDLKFRMEPLTGENDGNIDNGKRLLELAQKAASLYSAQIPAETQKVKLAAKALLHRLLEEQRVQFFVFIIESHSAVDIYHRRSEAEIIRQAVELNDIVCVAKTAISLTAFEACLKFGLSEAMSIDLWDNRYKKGPSHF